jgi:ribosomal protein S18 acetylase RimI-like enzyme
MANVLSERWGDHVVVARGERIDLRSLPALVAVSDDGGGRLGLLTYRIDFNSMEIVTVDALEPGRGVGSALLWHAFAIAREQGLWRVWLITTNDNLRALAFYLRRGMRVATVHENAASWSREVKPSIPEIGDHGIPIIDELELELVIGGEGPPPPRRVG